MFYYIYVNQIISFVIILAEKNFKFIHVVFITWNSYIKSVSYLMNQYSYLTFKAYIEVTVSTFICTVSKRHKLLLRNFSRKKEFVFELTKIIETLINNWNIWRQYIVISLLHFMGKIPNYELSYYILISAIHIYFHEYNF